MQGSGDLLPDGVVTRYAVDDDANELVDALRLPVGGPEWHDHVLLTVLGLLLVPAGEGAEHSHERIGSWRGHHVRFSASPPAGARDVSTEALEMLAACPRTREWVEELCRASAETIARVAQAALRGGPATVSLIERVAGNDWRARFDREWGDPGSEVR